MQNPHSADKVELLQQVGELLSCLPLGFISKGSLFPRSHRLQEGKARVRVTKRYLIWAPPGFAGCQRSPELREAPWVVPAPGSELPGSTWRQVCPAGLRECGPPSFRSPALSHDSGTSLNQTYWKGVRCDSQTLFGTPSSTPPTQGKFSVS